MNRFVLFAGPQAAGKSTVIAALKVGYEQARQFFPDRKLPGLVTLQETRQIIAHKYMVLGAIFMTPEQEAEVVESDLQRMDTILARDEGDLIYVDECNIFTIAHAIAHDIFQAEQYWEEYIRRLRRLNTEIIFLDVSPEVSWNRRRARYEQRLPHFAAMDHSEIMDRYRAYLERLHPLLKKVYLELPFRKHMINASLPAETVSRKVIDIITTGQSHE